LIQVDRHRIHDQPIEYAIDGPLSHSKWRRKRL
jgi:hypothetical protein